jgi:putative aldouronate transport system permease protein
MSVNKNSSGTTSVSEKQRLWKEIVRHKSVYALLVIPFVFYFIFRYLPIWNGQIAFRDFLPIRGVLGSPWVGLEHFHTFTNAFYFWELMRNTLMYSFGKLVISVPAAVLLAVMVYESMRPKLAKAVQTVAYLPHFLSWVIMYGILLVLLAPSGGIVNDAIVLLGGEPVPFMTNVRTFPWVVLISDAWKEAGWSAIIFIAALIGIDPALFEAAQVEGVNVPQRIWYVTLPSIAPVIVIVVLLRLGSILDAGFTQLFMLQSVAVLSVGDIIDTWVYRQGLLQFEFGLATAVGLFKGVIGLGLILFSNMLVKKAGGSSII